MISQACTPLPIERVALKAGLRSDEVIPWGRHKAKVDVRKVAERMKDAPDGSLVVVSGINPTPLGEGKSTTTIGVCQASRQLPRQARRHDDKAAVAGPDVWHQGRRRGRRSAAVS